jgi:hypothetical protein
MSSRNPVETVQQWQAAVNTQDTDTALRLSHNDIEIAGPRGSGRGRALLADWLGRAGATFRGLRWFCQGGQVVVEQEATWHDLRTHAPHSRTVVASHFLVADGVVVRVARHDTLESALAAAGLDPSEVAPKTGPPHDA